ncbi:rare lipoprotein A [Desulfobulbus propionicus DSM 2032]|uniref:Probable endolytic peptidoglycan transglycosylase RlpA n=1 Tax=Desulfobulbus propionicus (strain ATCC 33891 / DSM 2032 / VKM B-1956 / 1pr3) TaxID=577650 RepID=A0A7U3YLH7_DESPD|nr:septal ring lytic transglycosylase RlpA family protein [Desulfobulbus propionicus]ADW17565.1 rare lipoprotein A [Desulfobulbus propionicus DSM 2032]
MVAVKYRARAAVTILLALLLGISFGCASKVPKTREGVTQSGKKRAKSKATQRPYVINGITYYPIPSAVGYVERGLASWYGEPFHGRKTSNGETYNMYGDTAAHKTLPMDTMLLVKNLENGRSTVVRINDRGPFVQERIIDLTYTKAKALGVVGKGTAKVEIVALGAQEPEEAPAVAVAPPAAGKPAQLAKPKAKPKKAPPIPDFDKGNFYVQVGAFVKIENARTLAKAFAKRGRDVIIQQYPAAGMNLYRVMIFASNSLAKAKQYEQQMKNEGFRYALLLAR